MRFDRRGNAAITGLSLSVLLGFGALAVDVAYVRVIDAQLEAAIDAAVLGGAVFLDGTSTGIVLAQMEAVRIGNLNEVAGGFTLTADQVEPGLYTPGTGFTPTIDPALVNALRIDIDHTGINAILAGAAFGRGSLGTNAAATAWRAPPEPVSAVDCFLPIALPDCNFDMTATENPAPFRIAFGDSLQDNAGYAHPTVASASSVRDQFLGQCDYGGIGLGDTLALQNGVTTPVVQTVADLLNDPYAEQWPHDLLGPMPSWGVEPTAFDSLMTRVDEWSWGSVVGGPIALVDMGGVPGDCMGTTEPFNSDRTITGFTWGYIFDAGISGGADGKSLMVQIDTTGEHLAEMGTETDPDALGNVLADPPPVLVTD